MLMIGSAITNVGKTELACAPVAEVNAATQATARNAYDNLFMSPPLN
jgi:hypothetical protein